MCAITHLIADLKSSDRGKSTDLARTLTGQAYIDRIIREPGRKQRLKECEDAITSLIDLGLFKNNTLRFHTVYSAVLKFPLYGKTRAVNLTRGFSAARLAIGLSALEHDEDSWLDITGMHINVSGALNLLKISDYDEASEACTVLSALIKTSYADGHDRASCLAVDHGDLALDACEYACVLKELGSSKYCCGSDLEKCEWLLRRLPGTKSDMMQLRRQVVAHCRRSPDYANSYDDARARNNLLWWLESCQVRVSRKCTWPIDQAEGYYCIECTGVMSLSRCMDPRARYWSDECHKASNPAKRQKT